MGIGAGYRLASIASDVTIALANFVRHWLVAAQREQPAYIVATRWRSDAIDSINGDRQFRCR